MDVWKLAWQNFYLQGKLFLAMPILQFMLNFIYSIIVYS